MVMVDIPNSGLRLAGQLEVWVQCWLSNQATARLALGLQIGSGWSRLEANSRARVVVRGWRCNWDELQARVGVLVFLDPHSVQDH
jgi:hypothetical protein